MFFALLLLAVLCPAAAGREAAALMQQVVRAIEAAGLQAAQSRLYQQSLRALAKWGGDGGDRRGEL